MSKYNLIDIFEQYQIGSGWTKDFDYEGMLNAGLKATLEDRIESLEALAEDFTDVNYHREASHLYDALEALEKGDAFEAEGKISDFHAEIKKTMESFDMDMSDDLGAYMASKMDLDEDKYDDIVDGDDDIPASKKKAAALAYRKVDKGASYEKATSHIKETKPGYNKDGTPKSNDEMGDDEREDFYNDLDSVEESFDSLAKKLDKQKGIDKDEAAKIAGSIAAKKAAGAGKGPTAKQKKRMNEVRIEREVANRIEGLMNIQLKAKFLDVFGDLYDDLLEEDPFGAEDVINHLSNEMYKHISAKKSQAPEIPMFKGTRDALDDISIRETDVVNFDMKADTDYDEGLEDIEEIDSKLDPYEDRDEIIKQVMSLLIKEKGASREELKGFIEMHIEDILNAEDDDAIVDEFSQYLSVNESDKALQEHFKRFK